MAEIKIENLSFSYPLSEKKVLDNVSISIASGEFVLLCGRSGCGKTTLLRQIKSEISPKGTKNGKVYVDGEDVEGMTLRNSSQKIGFVMQNPDNQIVTDKVWHELAFGLENLGLNNEKIRLRVAEMTSYFGISPWFEKNVNELSGGQKQLLNLASVMAMHPEVLILDEPTSQLDPISAENFLSTVDKINKELGVTVIITEHRLEEIFPCVDRVIAMEEGKIIADGTPAQIGNKFESLPEFLRLSAPTAMRIFNEVKSNGACPVTVREGRAWLKNQKIFTATDRIKYVVPENEVVLEAKEISFRYSKNSHDVLNNLSFRACKGELLAILGANGSGKSTLVKLLSAIARPYSGKIMINSKNLEKYKFTKLYKTVSVLPQNVQALFTSKTVKSELAEISTKDSDVKKIVQLLGLARLLDAHPYDLSGGEQQRLALAKVLLKGTQIIIMDEPTKGMDVEFKSVLADIIYKLKSEGRTVIIISHDIEFCAKYADRCAMLFDKTITSVTDRRSFFNENRFYTTAANRMSRGIIEGAITDEDVTICLKEN